MIVKNKEKWKAEDRTRWRYEYRTVEGSGSRRIVKDKESERQKNSGRKRIVELRG
jgi:hypothetical protein